MTDNPAIPHRKLKRWFWMLLGGNVLFAGFSYFYLLPLGPGEIVQLEIARHTATASGLIQTWKAIPMKLESAITGTYLDFFFIFLYVSVLYTGCRFISRLTRQEVLITAGKILSYLVILAGICDMIENVAMLQSLRYAVQSWSVQLAYDMAVAKFSVVILSILFIMICLVFSIGSRKKQLWQR